MSIQEIVVLTVVHMNSSAPFSRIAEEAATLYQAPDFDSHVARTVLSNLCQAGLCEKLSQGSQVQLSSRGLQSLKRYSRQLGELKHAVDMALVTRVTA